MKEENISDESKLAASLTVREREDYDAQLLESDGSLEHHLRHELQNFGGG